MDKNTLAFPNIAVQGLTYGANGMTLRDYFAAQALPELMCDVYDIESDDIHALRRAFAGEAYAWADAMMKAREA
jgi:hypothetical protein